MKVIIPIHNVEEYETILSILYLRQCILEGNASKKTKESRMIESLIDRVTLEKGEESQ